MAFHIQRLVLPLVGLCSIHADEAASPELSAQQRSGRQIYQTACLACHQINGQGLPHMFPPLASSDWVVAATPDRIVRILMHGMVGPLHVNGEPFRSMAPIMPAQASLADAQIADVLTYIRSAWGNGAGAVSADEVAAIRAAETSRTAPWTETELLGIIID